MSIETWKEEFYPVPAAEVAEAGSDLELAKHCLRKWKGARPRNLREHGVRRDSRWHNKLLGEKENAESDQVR